MTREEKSQVIEELTAQLADNAHIYLTDISGLDAGNTSDLRRACFKANIKLAVVKNTLLEKAMEASDKDFGDLPKTLKGNTSVMYSETGNAPAKVIKAFRKKSDKPLLKGAFIEDIIKSGVAINQDLIELQQIINFDPAGFIDLGDIARSKGLPHHGLRGLAAYLLNFRISKSSRTSNWSANQLTKKQIKYAATDAWLGRELYLKYKQINVI